MSASTASIASFEENRWPGVDLLLSAAKASPLCDGRESPPNRLFANAFRMSADVSFDGDDFLKKLGGNGGGDAAAADAADVAAEALDREKVDSDR